MDLEKFKAQFRRGNLFHHVLLGTSMILEIKNNGISYCNPNNWKNAYMENNENLHRIDTIPLTEDWLLKLGLTKRHYEWEKDQVVYEFHYEKFVYTGGEGVTLSNPIESVHQLQNIHFALCGEELTIS